MKLLKANCYFSDTVYHKHKAQPPYYCFAQKLNAFTPFIFVLSIVMMIMMMILIIIIFTIIIIIIIIIGIFRISAVLWWDTTTSHNYNYT